MDKQFKRVGTHNGRFHADEVLSTAILKEIFDLEVIRSRDPEVLKGLDIVYDVGDGEFDHHQVEKKYRENGTPYAACGLLWRKFGRDVARAFEPELLDEDAEKIVTTMDEMLIEGIDAADNGMRTHATFIPTISLSGIVAEFNPTWDSGESEDAAFHSAVQLASTVFRNMMLQRLSIIKARSNIIDAYNNRPRPEILLLDRSYPWTQTLYEIDANNEVLYVIYPRDGEYMIQTVRKNDGTYGDRKRLPLAWAGKRDEELGRTIGIEDAKFCHPDRFIAGSKSMESIFKMAELAIAEPEPVKLRPAKEAEVKGFVKALRKFLFKKQVVIKRKG